MAREIVPATYLPAPMKIKNGDKNLKYTVEVVEEIVDRFEKYLYENPSDFIPDLSEFASLIRVPASSLYALRNLEERLGKELASKITILIDSCREMQESRLFKLALSNKVNSNIAAQRLNKLSGAAASKKVFNNVQINIDGASREEKLQAIFEELND